MLVVFKTGCGLRFFYFKQKTAYEMRISDWSSDVCSSDLNPLATILSAAMMLRYSLGLSDAADRIETAVAQALAKGARSHDLGGTMSTRQMGEIGRASCRERVCQYV